MKILGLFAFAVMVVMNGTFGTANAALDYNYAGSGPNGPSVSMTEMGQTLTATGNANVTWNNIGLGVRGAPAISGSGRVNLGDVLIFTFANSFTAALKTVTFRNGKFDIFTLDVDGNPLITGAPGNFSDNPLATGNDVVDFDSIGIGARTGNTFAFRVLNGGGGGNDYRIGRITFESVGVIPEPSTVILFGTGLLALLGWQGRRRWLQS